MPHRVIALVCALLAACTEARADPFEWDQPPPDEQLANDPTVIPLGMGALFVPALTDPVDEPPVVLVDPSQEVDDLPTGRRVIVAPGSYTVIVTSGSPAQGVAQAVEVVEAETTLVPVTWGALRVEVTDQRRVPHRGGYELIRADTREPYGTGFGADTLQGESLLTWLVPPGVYRIVKVGGSYRSLRDFATVYVPEGGFVRYRLVTDPNTGDFLGSGILLPDEFGTPKAIDRPWFASLLLGVDGAVSQQANVVGVQDQVVVRGDVFLDGQLVWHKDDHTVSSLLEVEEGASWIRPRGRDALPLVKTRDRIRGDLLYTWFPVASVGPYARAAVTTRAFPTDLVVTQDTTFLRRYADGSERRVTRQAGQPFHVADAWAPTLVRQGTGINTRFLNNRWFTLNVRLGLGLRQNRFGGAWVLDDDVRTEPIEYLQVESFDEQGIESTIVLTARLPGWATYSTDVELFADFGRLLPSVEWRNTLSLRLTRNLSVNYYLNVDLFPQVIDRAQIEQSLLLRASFALL